MRKEFNPFLPVAYLRSFRLPSQIKGSTVFFLLIAAKNTANTHDPPWGMISSNSQFSVREGAREASQAAPLSLRGLRFLIFSSVGSTREGDDYGGEIGRVEGLSLTSTPAVPWTGSAGTRGASFGCGCR